MNEVSELICLKCLERWIGVYDMPLKDIECECGEKGFIIKTGQTLKENECVTCKLYESGKCKLGLSTDSEYYCGYYKGVIE